MSDVSDKDLEGFFDDPDVVDVVAEEVADGLDDDIVETVKESPSQSTEISTSKTTSLGSVAIGFDFGSLNSLPGVVVGNTGIEVSRFPVERAKFSKGQRALISVLSDQVIVAKTHYDEDIGNFLCFGGACCQNDLARVRYVFPIVKYETDTKGKPVSKEVKCMALVVGQDTYQTLLDIMDLKGSLTQFDLLISCSDEQYQKITLQEAGEARYKKSAEMVRKINEFWAENGKHILKSTARKVTPQEYTKLKAGDTTSGEEVDFDDVFN